MSPRNIAALALAAALIAILIARYIQPNPSTRLDGSEIQDNSGATPVDQLKRSDNKSSSLEPPANNTEQNHKQNGPEMDENLNHTTRLSQVVWKDIKIGSSKKVEEGSNITFHVVMKLMTGKVVADSYRAGKPWQGIIGSGSILFGLDRGLRGMFQEGKRAIWIPQAFAYGENGLKPQIPPNADLYAEVEVIAVF